MNKVGLPLVDAIVVALMAQSYAIGKVMSKIWSISNFLDVVDFQSMTRSTFLACVSIPFQDRFLPFQILGATPPLVLPVVHSFGDSLAFHTAVHMAPRPLTGRLREGLSTHFTCVFPCFTTAFMGTIDVSRPGVGRRTLNWDPTSDTKKGDFLALVFGGAFSRTKPFRQVGFPATVRFFGDVITAHFTWLQLVNRRCFAGFIRPMAST